MMRTKHLLSLSAVGLLIACGGRYRDSDMARGPNGQGGADGNVIATGDPAEPGGDDPEWGIVGGADPAYPTVVQKVVNMVGDSQIRDAVSRRGLDLVNVMWEDTGRAEGSSLGPNISDLTLQVRYRASEGGGETSALMPVIRFPNFSDRTGDVPADKFFVRVGNHKNKKKLDTVPLTDVLRDLKKAGRLGDDSKVARLMLFGALNWTVQWYRPGGGLTLDQIAERAIDFFLCDKTGKPK